MGRFRKFDSRKNNLSKQHISKNLGYITKIGHDTPKENKSEDPLSLFIRLY
jgi:hypothetical protein